MTLRTLTAAAVVISLGTVLSSLSLAQDGKSDQQVAERKLKEAKIAVEAQKQAVVEAGKASEMAARAVKEERVRFRQFLPAAFVQTRHLTRLQDVAEKYSNSEDEKQKAEALQQLRDLSSQYFEEDMEVRKKELTDIQSRLEKLRAQLERRRAKKDEIVDLQVKVAINEAEGLGFTSAPRENFKFDVRVPAPAPVIISPNSPRFDVVTDRTLSSDMLQAPTRVEVAVPAPPLPLEESPFAAGPVTLGVGAKGDAVRLLQKALNKSIDPSPGLNIDGDFGPETDKAVRLFQSQHNLEESGEVDEVTRKMLDLPKDMPPFIKD